MDESIADDDLHWRSTLVTSRPELERLARAVVRRRDEVDDLVQDALTASLARPPAERERPMAWLSAVVRNIARKRRLALPRAELDPEELGASEPDPRRSEVLAAVRRAALELEEPYGTVIRLRFLEDHPVADVARLCGRPTNTVNSQLRRGLRLLEERLDRELGREERDWRALLLLPGRLRPAPRRAALAAPGGLLLMAALSLVVGTSLAWLQRPRAGEPSVAASSAREAGQPHAGELAPVRASGSRVSLEPRLAAPPPATATATAMADVLGVLDLEVVDGAGRPVEGAAVHVRTDTVGGDREPRGRTDETGRAEVFLTADDRRTRGSPRLDFWVHHREMVRSGLITIPFPFDRPRLRLELARVEATVRLRILDETGATVPAARVSIDLRGARSVDLGTLQGFLLTREATADEQGRCTLGLAAGKHAVMVAGAEHVSQGVLLECAAGSEQDVDVTLSRGSAVTGRALDAAGAPCAGAQVLVQFGTGGVDWGDRSATTDDTGHFRVGGLPAGPTWVVVHEPSGGLSAARLVELEPRDELEWSPRLERLPGVRLCLRDPQGAPVAGALVNLGLPASTPYWQSSTRSGPEGLASFDAIPRGVELAYLVFVDPERTLEAGRPAARGRGIRPSDEVLEVEVRAPDASGSTLAGRLAAPPELLARGKLMLMGTEGSVVVIPLAPDGAFEASEVPSGRRRLYFFHDFLGAASLEDLAVRPGEALGREYTLPDPVELRGPWPASSDPDQSVFRITWEGVLGASDPVRAVLWEATGTPPPGTRLLPGDYGLHVRGPDGVVFDGPVTVQADGKLELGS